MKPQYPNSLVSIRFSLAGWLLCGASLAWAQGWTVQTLSTRALPDGQPAKVAIAVPQAASAATNTPPVRHVLVYPQPLGTPQLKAAGGNIDLTVGDIWVRALPHLQQHGVSVVYVDAPSDAERRGNHLRPPREVRQDLAAAAKQAQQLFPGVQMHLAGFASAAPLLDIAGDLEGFSKIVLVGSALANSRSSDWSGLQKPVLMFHAPSAQCDSAPFLEAQMLAKRSRFTFVQVGYERQDSKASCGRTSQHVLQGQEAAVAKAVADWLDGKEVAPTIGYASPQIAWREQLLHYAAPASFGMNQLEMTLLYPPGNGPFPVAVFNHGDIEIDSPYMRNKRRFVDMTVAREFLEQGWAVAFPTRRGVGLSEGTYPLKNFQRGDADTTYKAREHAKDILPALEYLKAIPEIDVRRILIAGQSAGGYAAMHVASLNLSGVVGLVNFSGGRSDTITGQGPGYLHQVMVDGFAEFGKTTRIPGLWVFAENDSRYSANTIRASHAAFQAAGGKARLSLSPPIEGDGHFIHHKPELWRAALKEYLNEIGVTHAK